MKVKTVSVEFTYKRNMGDFESANVGCTLWADVDETDDLDHVMHDLWSMARANVRANLPSRTNGHGSLEIKKAFLGIPEVEYIDPEVGA